ncbi:MAG: 2-amino-4-hydroxy-6-hydroxymethyldihydropteridine diphosphokinase [Sphingomonas sp.]|nr:2-amino-4-hydroxy-6-hydroxymethyldihydropteridine diphosphokinase [Sphingomonas sp.]MDX3884270.1 2-amino-4-hydroxy-6-hydroxymethyldihydropteridine diphosphokinase [Sphingomonas sp.]
MPRTSYAIALGSNRRHGRHGPPPRVIAAALDALGQAGVRVIARSPIIATPAVGPAGRGFANAAAIVESDLAPPALLTLLKRIERAFGRRPGRRWGARVLDLDIILWSGGSWPPFPRRAGPGRLAVPHRAFAARAFVLDPLLRVAPGWRHPLNGRTVRQMRARLR